MVKLTQEQADYLETFGIDKSRASYYISRWGWDYPLLDGRGKVYKETEEKPFEQQSEKLKMLDAVINGYEVIEPKFKFYNFSDSSGTTPLYYAGQFRQLTKFEQSALEVKENSQEYKALLALGFDSLEV
ncbi:hypothetical protein N388_gp44 [Lactococcus phage phi7]|uniref:Uncharacterized protein n=1 Tax=Lactococcus phage phi7 TaxID=1262538 RepID=R9R1S1_9CAUD|nr:hypothetical protein N388_gp44 [Lactococcus phage phi7]AGI11223.1 hypothetical protein phi7_0044 [Lactococcus phage phi7]